MKKKLLIAFGIIAVIIITSIVVTASISDTNTSTATNTSTSYDVPEDKNSQRYEESQTSSGSQGESEGDKSITISDYAFNPSNITVKRGSRVRWTNNDAVPHDVVPDIGDSDSFKKSELLDLGETYSFTFNTPGTYTYHCSPHPDMKGTIVVTE